MITLITKTIKVVFPFVLGGAILYWMYRGFDWDELKEGFEDMNWMWMLLSFPFGISAQVFRGWRWKQTLEPLGEHPSTSNCINSVLVSYAASLAIPRIGEVSRCGLLKKYDGVSFTKAIGTVLTERVIDSIVVLLVTAVTLLIQLPVFISFFNTTGTSFSGFLGRFTVTGYWVTAICLLALFGFAAWLLHRLQLISKVKEIFGKMMEGVTSIKKVRNVPLFIFFTLGIWVSYFLHFYLTFYCFEYTSNLGMMVALVIFVVGSIAVVVPTPNGAGPWHFAVKTMLMLYGIEAASGAMFALIVHTIQTLLVVVLGIYGMLALNLTNKPKL